MKNLIRTCSTALLAVAFGAPSAFAQEREGFDVQYKARTGLALKSVQELTRRVIGFGIDVGYNTSLGRFSAELGYQYKPGDRYIYDVHKAPTVPGTVLMSTAFPYYGTGTTAWPNGVGSANINGFVTNGDFRRSSLQGAALRISYEYDLNELWIARGGVQLFGARFHQEVIGSVVYRDPANETRSENPYNGRYVIDSYAGRHEDSDMALSPYIGVGRRLGSNITFEFNLIGISYKAIDYVHVAGTGSVTTSGTDNGSPGVRNQLDRIEEKKTMVPHIELAVAFRF